MIEVDCGMPDSASIADAPRIWALSTPVIQINENAATCWLMVVPYSEPRDVQMDCPVFWRRGA
ncbi:hypothetical protein WL23_23845 [Burkholderia multivorans]|nr:hypothetical protein WL23_23845 [Burkholderia multivorans]